MGDNRLSDATPQHLVKVSSFGIGKFPVTNHEYAEFIADGGYATESYWTTMGRKWQRTRLAADAAPGFWGDVRFDAPRQPVVGVSWYEAAAFCAWLSARDQMLYRLPTESEWEYAARGSSNPPPNFPWGDTFERGRANTAEAGLGATSSVDLFPEGMSPFGVWDMCGNVFEWTLSKWGMNWQTLEFAYPYRADDGREELAGSAARIIRGGSWFNTFHEALCAFRSRYLAGSRASNIGFRVVTEMVQP